MTGQNVLVTGGAGAVGNYAIQLAQWGGAARVIATVSSDDKAKLADAAGADVVINYRDGDVAAEVMAATADAGVDRIIEVAFGANLPTTQAVLKDNGVIATYASDGAPTPTLPFYPLMTKNALLRWVYMYKIPDDAVAQAHNDITTWLAARPSQHLVAKEFSLEDTAAAHEYLESGQATGTVVVTLDQAR